MERRQLIKRLGEVKLGETLTVNGVPFIVREIVSYLDYPDRWFNWVHYGPDGLELALEREKQEMSLWQQVKDVTIFHKRTIKYRGETYKLDEEESGEAETIVRKTDNGKEVSKEAKTPYDIFIAPSGRRLCREIWEGKECWYHSEPGLITISF